MLACQVASVLSNSLQPYGLYPTRLFCSWDSPGKNTGVGCHALLQGIFPTLGLNPHLLWLLRLLHCWRILYHFTIATREACVYIYTHAHTFNCSRGVKAEYYSSRRWCEEVLYLKQVRSMWACIFSSSMSIILYNMFPSYFMVFLLGSNEIVHIKEIC